jgi:hypothetical protein
VHRLHRTFFETPAVRLPVRWWRKTTLGFDRILYFDTSRLQFVPPVLRVCFWPVPIFLELRKEVFLTLQAQVGQIELMKIRLLYLLSVALCAACSSPKLISYKFDYHDYNAGRRSPIVDAEKLEASIEPVEASVVVAESKPYEEMSDKEQRFVVKEFKKEIRKVIKKNGSYKASPYKAEEVKVMDHDLKLGLIFGSVGFVGLLLSNASFAFIVVGIVALCVGVYFFVKWLIRQ